MKRIDLIQEYELSIPKKAIYGTENPDVKRLQEWLNYHGFRCKIDSEFGPATLTCLNNFEQFIGLPSSRYVQSALWNAAIDTVRQGFTTPFHSIPGVSSTIAEDAILFAERCVSMGAREYGGQNSGFFVRMFTLQDIDGFNPIPWCAAFVSFSLMKVEKLSNDHKIWNLGMIWSCDQFVEKLRSNGYRKINTPKRGSLFFINRKDNKNDYVHVGFVSSWDPATNVITTVEGNSNDEGSFEGNECCSRYRKVTDNYTFYAI